MNYLYIFLISMIPVIELRGAVIYAAALGMPVVPSLAICTLGNMIPVPFIYLFARGALQWGVQRKYIGKICKFLLVKGETAGRKLTDAAGRKGSFVALLLFIGIPIPGTGAWTGTLAASLLNIGFKTTMVAAVLGIIMSGSIMMLLSMLGFGIFT